MTSVLPRYGYDLRPVNGYDLRPVNGHDISRIMAVSWMYDLFNIV